MTHQRPGGWRADLPRTVREVSPEEVSARYPDVDQSLLAECRRLVLAMVAAWRWDIRDEFPDGHQYGRNLLSSLRQGPPWPAIGTLAAE